MSTGKCRRAVKDGSPTMLAVIKDEAHPSPELVTITSTP
jgi:hypothetical protein